MRAGYSFTAEPGRSFLRTFATLDHPGLVLDDPIGPMARLQLARALSASGDRAKSAEVYTDLLAIWKDADPDIPILKQAKAESARLQ